MRCLLFGFGYMGTIRYQMLQNCPEVQEIFVVDPDPAAKGRVRYHGMIPTTFLLPGEAIPWDRVDAVFICTPNHVTAELCVEALRRCGRVFCEKPPGRDWDDFCRIEEAANSTPGHLLVFGFNHRLHPSVQAAKTLVGQGGLGDILYLKGTYGKSGGVTYPQNWRTKPELAGGGILLDQGIHMLDLFQLFLGPIRPTDALLRDTFWGCGLEDNALVLLQSEHGVPAFLHSSGTLWKHTFHLEIGCRDGYLIATGLLSKTGSYGRERLVIGRRQFEDEALALGNPREEIVHFDRDESWEKEVNEFLTAIRERRPATHGTLEEAKRVMQIIRDVYAMAGRRVASESR